MTTRVCLVAVALLLLGACSAESDPESQTPAATAAPESTTVAAPTAEPAVADERPSLVETSVAFLDHLETGDYEQMVSLMTPSYRDESFGTTTAAQFWTFSSRFDWVPDVPADCGAVGTQVECSWAGADAVSAVLGYQKRSEFLFSYDDDGAVDDIIYFANDSELLVGFMSWVDENHPGSPACGATGEAFDAYYGGPGTLATADGEVFGAACAARMVDHAAEYRDSGLYLPPLDG